MRNAPRIGIEFVQAQMLPPVESSSRQNLREFWNVINIGIVGYGYWGPNLVRNFAEAPGAKVASVSDLDSAKLALVQRRFPGVRTTTDFRELLNDGGVGNAFVIGN